MNQLVIYLGWGTTDQLQRDSTLFPNSK